MTIRRLGLGLILGATALACSKGGSDAGPSSGDPATDGGTGPSQTGTDSGSTTTMTTTPPAGDAGTSTTASQPMATLRNTGRRGDTLVFDITGNDSAGQTTEAQIQFLDSNGVPVLAFDTNWDGVADASHARVHFDQSTLGKTSFTATITLPGLYASASMIASASVALSDVDGNVSPAMTATLATQTVAMLGDACDPAEVTSRCAAGLACGGATPTCQAGVAPTLTQVAYYGGSAPAELVLGSDPDEDLATIKIDFLDSMGNSLKADLTGDGDLSSTVNLNANSAVGQTFFFQNYPASSFATSVPKIAVTPIDSQSRSGASMTASLGVQPQKSAGSACDGYGIIGCASGLACSPGVIGATNKCASVSSLQTAECAAAPTAAASGVIAAWGTVDGTSLWDPPSDCVRPSELGRPEALVTLKLAHAASTLTVSTATPETDFDTVLYVLPSCAATSAQALGCNDDTQGFSSTLTLNNVAAGTYTIVVDSANAGGGHFGLTVATQ